MSLKIFSDNLHRLLALPFDQTFKIDGSAVW